MKWIILGLALAIGGGVLAVEKSRAKLLQLELSEQRALRQEWERQQIEHTRLLSLKPSIAERADRATEVQATRQPAIEANTPQSHDVETSNLPVGELLPSTYWRDCGQQTSAATVQTMLWAAMGGDTGRLAGLFHLDDATRQKLQQLYATLPTATRATYPVPEHMLAAFTAKAIPVGAAQIVWFQHSAPDEAVSCIWVSNPMPSATAETANVDRNAPPRQPENPKRSQALLTLRRFADGWRVVVPVAAVDRLAGGLGRGK